MNRKTIGVLIILAGLIILGLIIYFLFFFNFNPTVAPVQPVATSSPITAVVSSTPVKKIINIKTYTKEELNQDELTRLAASFAERYSSYSNQSNYQNMLDLKIFMTTRFQKITDDSIRQMAAKNPDHSIYYGITAKAVSENVQQFDNNTGTALVIVTTERRESLATSGNATSYPQNVSISLVKENGVWKIDDAVWAAKK